MRHAGILALQGLMITHQTKYLCLLGSARKTIALNYERQQVHWKQHAHGLCGIGVSTYRMHGAWKAPAFHESSVSRRRYAHLNSKVSSLRCIALRNCIRCSSRLGG